MRGYTFHGLVILMYAFLTVNGQGGDGGRPGLQLNPLQANDDESASGRVRREEKGAGRIESGKPRPRWG